MTKREFSPEGLKEARLRRGFTQDDLAHELRRRDLRTNGTQVGRWESGLNTPRASVIPVLADVLEVSMDELYGSTSDDDEEAALLREIRDLPVDLRRRIERVIARRVLA